MESIKLNAYRLLALFYANKEISRLSDPEQRNDSASQLERMFFAREMTNILLSIAIGVRVLDDQMKQTSNEAAPRQAYLQRRDSVNRKHSCMMFDSMTIREVCNKIIHATTVEPHSTQGSESHQIDEYNWIGWAETNDHEPGAGGPEPAPIEWEHLSGHIRLCGLHNDKHWGQILDVPVFIEAIFELLPQG